MTLDELLAQSKLDSLEKTVQVELPDGSYRDIKDVLYLDSKVVIRLETGLVAE